MSDLNKILLIGHLGANPETRFFENGDPFTTVSLATNEKWTEKEGGVTTHTEWHNLIFYGRLSEIAAQYLKKGSYVYVEGKFRTRQWEDESGTVHSRTQVRVSELHMLDKKPEAQETQEAGLKEMDAPKKNERNAYRDAKDGALVN